MGTSDRDLGQASNETGAPSFGLPEEVSISINTIVVSKFAISDALSTVKIGNLGGSATTVVIGSVDVVDAYKHGTSQDVVVQSSGVAGAVAGGLIGAKAGVIIGAPLGPWGSVIIGDALSIVGTYKGEEWTQDLVDQLLKVEPTETDKLRAEFKKDSFADKRDKIANDLFQSVDNDVFQSKGMKSYNGSTIVYNSTDGKTGAQVEVTVVRSTETGQTRAVFALVPTNNRVASGMEGNSYPAAKVQAGYELNALDRISELQNVWKNTPDPGPTGPQGSGIGPSDPNDPRGPWQTPGAPADRTGGTKARPGGSEGGDGRREGAAPPKPESWADRHSGPVWEGKGRGGDGTMGRTATRSQGGPKAEDRREGKAPERLDKHGRKESDPKFVGPQPVLLDLDGNGVKITEYHNATRLMTGKDGLRHRSSWAGAGDGVLFCDPDVRSAITERRQHVFTEWNPTAAGDPEAGRTGWRRKCPRWTNADGCLGSTGWQRTSGTWEGYGSRGFGGAGAAGDARSPGG